MKNKFFNRKVIVVIIIVCIILLCGIFLITKKSNSAYLQNQIADLELKLSSLNNEKEDLNEQISQLNSKITTLKKTISSNEEEINNLENDKEKLLKTNNELTAQIEKMKETITNLNNQITQMNAQIQTLESSIASLKEDLKIEKETYIVFYSVNNDVIYQEQVKKGKNVKNVPSSPIDDTTVVWSNDGKNIQSDMVIHGTIYCTLTFESATDDDDVDYAFLSINSYQVPYNTVLEFTNSAILIDNQEIVTSTYNEESDGVQDSYAGWGIYDEEGVLNVKNSGTYKVTGSQAFFAYYGGCILKGTKIAMANGTTKNVEDLVSGDKILSYDFFVGEMASKEVIGVLKGISPSSNVITINLANGSVLNIVDMEYVFDADDKKYYFVTPDTYESLVGKNLVVNNNGNREISKVVSVSLEQRETEHYTLFIEDSSNYIASGILTRSFTYWLNDYFTFTEDFRIDQNQLDEDILQYGLYTYDDVKDYVSYDIFEKMNLKYAKFIAGKGIASSDYVLESLSMLEYEITQANKRFNK